jgi:hypothetical protein
VFVKLLVAAFAVVLSGAGLAAATPPEPPHGGPCHVYWNPSPVAHDLPVVPQPPGTPFLFCDY